MSFTWPAALLLGLAVPLVLATYLLTARRRRRHAVTYSSLALLRKALPRRSRWRRHIPVALLLTSLAILAVAAARPQLTSHVPVSKTTIILALDESGSMCLTDVLPNRLTVAQHAAREFVDAQPKGAQMGLVVFAGYAELAVPPTTDRSALDQALNNLSTSPGTGSSFSLLPPENSSGNWVKVVQRLPVRIALDPGELRAHPLRVGLSMDADIDVSRR